MARRHKVSGKRSRRLFTATGRGTHPRNLRLNPMRGGIRA